MYCILSDLDATPGTTADVQPPLGSINDDDNEDDYDDDNEDDNDDSVNEIALFKCTRCNREFQYKSWFNRHVALHMPGLFVCQHCPKVFSREDALKKHINYHFKTITYECEICHKVFYDKYNLTNHTKQIHGTERDRARCKICGLSFSCKKSLRYYENSHFGIKPYKCAVCNSCFCAPNLLSRHKKL